MSSGPPMYETFAKLQCVASDYRDVLERELNAGVMSTLMSFEKSSRPRTMMPNEESDFLLRTVCERIDPTCLKRSELTRRAVAQRASFEACAGYECATRSVVGCYAPGRVFNESTNARATDRDAGCPVCPPPACVSPDPMSAGFNGAAPYPTPSGWDCGMP
jgi:hypothetical protein